jgi:formiminoglutamase
MTQSQKRFSESLEALFHNQDQKKKLLILKSSSDVGVMRNGGRNGAKYAPQAFLSVFKKLKHDEQRSKYRIEEVEVASTEEEEKEFAKAQILQSERIKQILEKNQCSFLCHLGGGHDHIYPLLTALSHSAKKVTVINIDAHADTRTDQQHHSGTPFRQFASNFEGQFQLFQIGLHPFANSLSTLSSLEKGTMSVLSREELKHQIKRDAFFEKIKSTIDSETIVIFSLDADALDGSEVPGVSATNANGITINELQELWHRYEELKFSHQPILGIYELNPVFDAPSMLSMHKMATFVYSTMK